MPLREFDYVSPNLEFIDLDDAFPNVAYGAPGTAPWGRLELGLGEGLSHGWYCHSSRTPIGYANRDELVLMYNIASRAAHGAGLEIGCFYGWTTAYLARHFDRFDVIDPILGAEPLHEILASLEAAGVTQRCKLQPGISPQWPITLGRQNGGPLWSFALIDGDHGFPAPLVDAGGVERFMLDDAIIVLHDVYFPPVSEALDFLKFRGWKTRVCQTSNGIGIAWRGSVMPPEHIPDPSVAWRLPSHMLAHVD